MKGKGGKGLLAGNTTAAVAAANKEKDKKRPVSRSSRAGLQVAIHGLLPLLDDPHRKICTAIGMAVETIAHYDWPQHWPDLLPSLRKCITDQPNMNAVESFASPYEVNKLE